MTSTDTFFALRTGRPEGIPYALTVHDLGPVNVPSGRLEASDPYVTLGEGLEIPVPPGSHPVRLTVADVSPEQDGSHPREAYLSVVLDGRPAAEVRPFVPAGALADATDGTADESGENLCHGVGVDAGTVGFADAAGVRVALARVDDWYEDVVEHDGPDAWFTLQDSTDHLVPGAANVALPGVDGGENVVISHSGWGDGFYPVVTTHAEDGTLTGVHVDLQAVTHEPWWSHLPREQETAAS
ncbi:DUF4241 domain-containing protein [Isoptericola sp. NEAU-Y5]|uniref:DUF4241 domain-containing protein n=1 Tax=Isoptericola luteus TaxID=2879484 RepID=A0ABS7ZFX5_9MICO|nr:DUF4241 domain-containing protein [Isoptericola sp. NEAU-Y5]MCA5893927.1 DUF4241 domain-containing protein [Isoptericola sp. NEAU-Y5]